MGIGSETIIGNRNRTREMWCEVEWNRDQGLGFRNGDQGREHETMQVTEHETCGGTESGTGI